MKEDKRMKEYIDWASYVVDVLRNDNSWEERYDGYAEELLKNRERFKEAKRKFREYPPLHYYLTIGKIKSGKTQFDIRYLGQSVGTLSVVGDEVILSVSEEQAQHNETYFGCTLGHVSGVSWSDSEFAKKFRRFYKKEASGRPNKNEHMVESALFFEIGKKRSDNKTLCDITPVDYNDIRMHMKTAVAACDSGTKEQISVSEKGGEIDLFCRRSILAGRGESRLVVIEVKDKNEKKESFDVAMKQAISYAVFIRALIHSKAGEKWMEVWGMKNQKKNSFTIDCAVAMPKGETKPSYIGKEPIKLENEDGTVDSLELHYIEITSQIDEDNAENVSFETSMKSRRTRTN